MREFEAPAKINVRLEVLGRRSDGYHRLAMIMQRISLSDRVRISLTDQPGVRVKCDGVTLVPGEENIAARAGRRMLELSGSPCGVDIEIEKKIPVAAGLGGGSSDAAAVLMGLNAMLGLDLEQTDLMKEGVQLGADVPFFIYGQTAWATGIGEELQPFELPDSVWYVLVNPGFPVSTASVYQNLGLTSPGGVARMPGFPRDGQELVRLLYNDLESAVLPGYPAVAEIKNRLKDSGAAGVLMSGSGPTVFGVFFNKAQAAQVADEFNRVSGWRAFAVSPI